jgi:hypothetical protein
MVSFLAPIAARPDAVQQVCFWSAQTLLPLPTRVCKESVLRVRSCCCASCLRCVRPGALPRTRRHRRRARGKWQSQYTTPPRGRRTRGRGACGQTLLQQLRRVQRGKKAQSTHDRVYQAPLPLTRLASVSTALPTASMLANVDQYLDSVALNLAPTLSCSRLRL